MSRSVARAVRGGLVVAALAAVAGAAALASAANQSPSQPEIVIDIRYSHFDPPHITVPVGVPVTIRLRNEDPIDHEWIVGDAALHAVHRTSAEPLHPHIATEIAIPAMSERTTTITFQAPGELAYICHLPGHEAYGMVGWVTVEP
ncbi:MAG TPA: cupredoxin domain-containing protein [Candidatus Eisenbacteria bacterium]|nr:cupredoxin domain-containing protein [Candidatus Eisenbacteria bacterium]